jgi:hypothetical protein
MFSKKHSKLTKKQTRGLYGRFASPSRMQEVGSASRCRTAPPLSPGDVGGGSSSSDSVVEMWEVSPPSTLLEEASFNDFPSASSGYNDECPLIKEVSSYELLLDFNCLV